MAIDLKNLKPHKVSRDLSGYITFIYGAPKTGKTTLAVQMPDALLLAFERGYNALPGVMAQDITSWGEMKTTLRQLKDEDIKNTFKTVIIDTIDIAADLCQKYICNQLGIENIGDGGWTTNGWAKYKKEFEDTFRTLTQLGYAVVFISHEKDKTVTPKGGGKEYTQTCPSVQTSALSIIENMADLYGYACAERTETGSEVYLTLRSVDDSVRCGGRFKYITPKIKFNYNELVKALHEAIDKEAAEHDNKFVTNERETAPITQEYDYDALKNEFATITNSLMEKNQTNGPKIVSIVDKYLGKGKKVLDATPEQAELIYLIINELKSL